MRDKRQKRENEVRRSERERKRMRWSEIQGKRQRDRQCERQMEHKEISHSVFCSSMEDSTALLEDLND